jgi:hypothetical protein
MPYTLSPTDIESVFVEMNLPLIERAIDEIQAAKDRMLESAPTFFDGDKEIQRTTLSGGTGKSNSLTQKNAELERSSFRT